MRLWTRSLAGGAVAFIAAGAAAQPLPEGGYRPSGKEVVALVDCETLVLGKPGPETKLRSGIYDRLQGQWLMVGDRRDEVIDCLVDRHGWTTQNTPDGRRLARAPR